MKFITILIFMLSTIAMHGQTENRAATRGILLEDLTWVEAEKILTPDKVIVIPLGLNPKSTAPISNSRMTG